MENPPPRRAPHPGDNLIGSILRSLQGKQVCIELTNDFEVVGLLHHSANDMTTTLKDAKACLMGGWGDEVQHFDVFTALGKHIRAVHIPRAINLPDAVATHLGAMRYAQNRNRKNKRSQGPPTDSAGDGTSSAPLPPGVRLGQRAPTPRPAIVLGADPALSNPSMTACIPSGSSPNVSTTEADLAVGDFDWGAIGAALDTITLPVQPHAANSDTEAPSQAPTATDSTASTSTVATAVTVAAATGVEAAKPVNTASLAPITPAQSHGPNQSPSYGASQEGGQDQRGQWGVQPPRSPALPSSTDSSRQHGARQSQPQQRESPHVPRGHGNQQQQQQQRQQQHRHQDQYSHHHRGRPAQGQRQGQGQGQQGRGQWGPQPTRNRDERDSSYNRAP